jgi:hypothetical protein
MNQLQQPVHLYSTAICTILEVLGEPETEEQREACRSFESGDYYWVSAIAAMNVDDCFCQALACLGEALNPKTPSQLPKSLGDATRNAADHVARREKAKALAVMEEANALSLKNY